MTHFLKINPEYFDDVKSGRKTFEVRKFDRDFNLYDILVLNEYDVFTGSYTGRSVSVRVVYLLDNPSFCKEGYVILGIRLLKFFCKE